MYAVIFKAEINQLDDEYFSTAKKMRDLALEKYSCLEFNSACENNVEIAISYWESLDHIKTWKSDVEHQSAQALGKKSWYKSYTVEITEIIRSYSTIS